MFQISEEQKDWILRRDYFSCNFFHPQSGPYQYFCRDYNYDVYEINYFPVSQRILWPWVRLQYQFISLCSKHLKLMTKYSFQGMWQKDLYKVAKLNTLYYAVHAPEDPFPG